MPLSEIHSPLFGRALVSAGFAVGGGAIGDDQSTVDALADAAWTLAERLSCPSLELRGGGELLGLKQSGDADYRLATPEQLIRLLPVAHDDARLFVERDGGMEGARGEAVRLCLYLFERDAAVPLLRSG